MKIITNYEFEKLAEEQSSRLYAYAKSRREKDPKGWFTINDLDDVLQVWAYSGEENSVCFLKSLRSLAKSGKLEEMRKGNNILETHIKEVAYLHKKGEIAFDIGDHIMLKDNGKRGTVVDYRPDSKEFLVVLNPFQLTFYPKKDLEKVAKKV